jgi:hypothetical protein
MIPFNMSANIRGQPSRYVDNLAATAVDGKLRHSGPRGDEQIGVIQIGDIL